MEIKNIKKELEKLESFSEKLMKELLKQNAKEVILSPHLILSNQTKFSKNKINVSKNWIQKNLSLFVNVDGKLITTSIKNIPQNKKNQKTSKIIEGIIKELKFKSKFLPKNDSFYGIQDKKLKTKKIKGLFDKKIENLNEKVIDVVEDQINYAQNFGGDESYGVLETTTSYSSLLTSTGIRKSEKSTNIYYSIRVLSTEGIKDHKDFGSGHDVAVGTTLNNTLKEIKKATQKASAISALSIKPKNKKISGKFDVIFEPLPMADFIERIGDATSIFSIESGLSFLGNKLNKKVASEDFTLYDDGTIKEGFGSTSYDEEGTPTQKNLLISKGILKKYIHNYSTAKRYNTKSTGNAGLISPSPHNLVVKKGNSSFEEMIKETKKGLYITNLWYTRFKDYVEGTFSTIPRDGIFYIENGEIIESIKNIRISENILNIIKNIELIGKKIKQIHSWEVETPTFTPPMKINKVNITKPK